MDVEALGALSDAGEVVLPGRPASVRAARHVLRDYVRAHELGSEVADTAALLVSETVTNAVVHARSGAVSIRFALTRGTFRVEVSDTSETQPNRRAARPSDEGGRGLALLDALADRWGCDGRAGGKVVWFELRR